MIFHILAEGSADVPTITEILLRHFGLTKGSQFQIHPHQGRGKLPADPAAPPAPTHRTLLSQLPATLRGYASKGQNTCIVILLDQDDDDCATLLADIQTMISQLEKRPPNILIRIAMEEIESWFLADQPALSSAYPNCDLTKIPPGNTDLLDDPSDILAMCLGEPLPCTGQMKAVWAENITPLLDLNSPKSPSLVKFVEGIQRFWPM